MARHPGRAPQLEDLHEVQRRTIRGSTISGHVMPSTPAERRRVPAALPAGGGRSFARTVVTMRRVDPGVSCHHKVLGPNDNSCGCDLFRSRLLGWPDVDPVQARGSAYRQIAIVWSVAPTTTSEWKTSWKPNEDGRGSGARSAYTTPPAM